MCFHRFDVVIDQEKYMGYGYRLYVVVCFCAPVNDIGFWLFQGDIGYMIFFALGINMALSRF